MKQRQDAFTEQIMRMVGRNEPFDRIEAVMIENKDLKPPYEAVFDLGVEQIVKAAKRILMNDPSAEPYGHIEVFVKRLARDYPNDEIDVKEKYLSKGMVEELGALQYQFNNLIPVAQEAMAKLVAGENVDDDVARILGVIGGTPPNEEPWNDINELLKEHRKRKFELKQKERLKLQVSELERHINDATLELSKRSSTISGKFRSRYGNTTHAKGRMMAFRKFLGDMDGLMEKIPNMIKIDDKTRTIMLARVALASGDSDEVMEPIILGISEYLNTSPHALLNKTISLLPAE